MKCYYHPDIEAVTTCVVCGKAICQTCNVYVEGRSTCKHCLSVGKAKRIQTQTTDPINPLAIVSLILGVLGLCTGILSIPAWVVGNIAQKQIMENSNQKGILLAKIGKMLGMGITILYGTILLCYSVSIVSAFVFSLIQ